MKLIYSLIFILPILAYAEIDDTTTLEIIKKSEETRKSIKDKLKQREPANASIENWQDFEKVMQKDYSWEKQVDELIRENE